MEDEELKARIEEWKSKYGANKVKQIEIPLDDEGKATLKVIAHVPSLKVMNEWEKFLDKNPLKAKEIIVKNCLLTGVDKIYSEKNDIIDDELFMNVYLALTELMPIRKSLIKNL